MGQHVHVLLDRIDREQRRLQFALVPSPEQTPPKSLGSPRKDKTTKGAVAGDERRHASPDRVGKKQKGSTETKKVRNKKSKGKRK